MANTNCGKKQITLFGKISAGVILVLFTLAALSVLIGFWPNRMPGNGEKCSAYQFKWFHVTLVDSNKCKAHMGLPASKDAGKSTRDSQIVASAFAVPPDSALSTTDSAKRDSLKKIIVTIMAAQQAAIADSSTCSCNYAGKDDMCIVDLNTLLLLLVAAAGFLGNMIYVSSSFTTFVGADTFRRSWVLWYCVKPFTAAALAITIYFVFRAGFLNSAGDAVNINLYGVIAMSLLAGLFTDNATQKLKEVFDVMFKIKDNRPDPLGNKFKITGIRPDQLQRGVVNAIELTGEYLDKETITISMNEKPVTGVTIAAGKISFNYTIAATDTSTTFKLCIDDPNGYDLYTKTLPVV